MEKARKIFNEMILDKSQLGKYSSSIWLEFIEFERQYGDEKHERKLLTRAIHELIDDEEREIIYDVAQRFEKLNGNVHQFAKIYSKFEAFRAKREAEKERAAKEAKKSGKSGPNQQKNQSIKDSGQKKTETKDKPKSNKEEPNNSANKRKVNFYYLLYFSNISNLEPYLYEQL